MQRLANVETEIPSLSSLSGATEEPCAGLCKSGLGEKS